MSSSAPPLAKVVSKKEEKKNFFPIFLATQARKLQEETN